jgi:hypothetical protein
MRSLCSLVALAALGAACGGSSGSYTYDPYYGYYPVAYDDYYYDASMMSGYYYYPSVYYYGYRTEAAVVTVVPPSVRLLLERWGAPIDPTCVTATSGADADGDGIAATSTIAFRCETTVRGGTARVSGSVTVEDLNDAAADAGFSITFNGFDVRVVSATGVLAERVVNGKETIDKQGDGVRVVRTVVVNATDTFPDGVSRTSTLDMNSLGLLVPEPASGTALISRGAVTLSGSGTFTGPDGVVVTLTRQTDPTLHWNNDCTKVAGNAGPFDGGAIIYRSSSGRQTRIVYESCTSATATNTSVALQ